MQNDCSLREITVNVHDLLADEHRTLKEEWFALVKEKDRNFRQQIEKVCELYLFFFFQNLKFAGQMSDDRC